VDIRSCPECAGADFAFRGVGTQRVEAALAKHLPDARVLRMDTDSTRKRGALAAMIADFESGAADILLGTQMVAKGFDFPHVTLVGVINADREMGFPDFRGQERAFQLLTQVAGRAGRGAKMGQVVFQTYLPDHHVISAAGRQDFSLFCRSEIEERRIFGYPPHRRMANILFDGPDEEVVIRRATHEAECLARFPELTLRGPAPMPLSRLKGQFRWHLTVLAAGPGALTRVLQSAPGRAPGRGPAGRVRIQVDMDPVSML
jgi:primosomal protein N' (replication factor Y)